MQLLPCILLLTCISQTLLNTISPERLLEIASIINSTPNITWQAEPPKIPLVSTSSLASTFLHKHTPHSHHPFRSFKSSHLTFPDNFNLQTHFPMCESITKIYDQANCGSCWAVSAAAVISDRICIQSKQQYRPIISSAHIITCCKNCGFRCGGGFANAAFQFWISHGVPTGGNYGDTSTCKPYFFPPCSHFDSSDIYDDCPEDDEAPLCEENCIPEYGKKLEEDLYFGNDYYYLSDKEEQIMEEIYMRGSVQASFEVYEDFLIYSSGIYQYQVGDYLGGHAVKIIGWGIEKGVKYWLCVNSWNEEWGDKGMFKIKRGVDECGIESEILGAEPKF